MNRVVLVVFVVLLFAGCATSDRMGSAEFRERDYTVGKVTLSPQGLTPSQIRTITSTTLPASYPIDFSLIVVKDHYVSPELEYLFTSSIVDEIQKSEKIARVVPIPKLIFPRELTFTAIQELGIRTLTGYVAIFVLDTDSAFKYTKILESEYNITSAVDFLLVDPQTTASMASDKIFSEIIYKENIFKTGEKEKAQKEIFTEQGKEVGELLVELFN